MNNKIESLFVDEKCKIIEALDVMTKAGRLGYPPGIAVVTKESKFVGILCDGDIRRALIKRISLDEPVSKICIKDPVTVRDNLTNKEVINTVLAEAKKRERLSDYKVDKIIVVNEKNDVVNIVNYYDLLYKTEIKNKRICILGMGYVGLTLGLVLADLELEIVGYDVNKDLIKDLNNGKPHFYEVGLEPLLKFHQENKNIIITDDKEKIFSDIYIISVGTPVFEDTKKPDLSYILEVAENIGKILKKEDLVILRSTVPIGTSRDIVIPILEKHSNLKCGTDFYLVFAPERTIEGKALEELKELPQPIGGINKASSEFAEKLFQLISPTIIILDTLEEAELLKLINNTFRDVSFGFSNQIALICEKTGIDTVKIIKTANRGYKRNPIPLPSPGVGGACLKKDPYILMDVSKKMNTDSSLIEEARKVNEFMPGFVADKVVNFLKSNYSTNSKIKIYALGLAFKGYPETSDIRNSSSIDIIQSLRSKLSDYELDICGFDEVIQKEVVENNGIKYLSYSEGFEKSHCVLILNNHPAFSKLDIFNYIELMEKPGLFFDGWYLFPPNEIRKIKGIKYDGVGGYN